MNTMTKQVVRVAALAAAMAVVGCSHKKHPSSKPASKPAKVAKADPQVTDIQIVDAVRDSGVKAAIVSQHTLFPYHFENDGDMLNKLGERDLAVLAAHLRSHTGQINIPKGNLDAKLYDARVAHVSDALKAAGVNADNVKIVDAMGGTGSLTPSEDVIRDLRNTRAMPGQGQQQQQQPQQSQNSGTVVPAS